MEIYLKGDKIIMNMRPFGIGIEEALDKLQKWLNKERGINSIKVEVKDNKTTVTLDDGRVGVARCNPCDKFDIVTGIRVALDDIERKSRKLSTLEKQIIQIALDIGAKTIQLLTNDDYTDVVFLNDVDHEIMGVEVEDSFDWLEPGKKYVIKELIKNRL